MSATMSLEVLMAQPARVTVAEFEGAPGPTLHRVQRGQVIEITSRGQVVARMEPVEPRQSTVMDPLFRRPGTCKGQFSIANDFDAALTDFEEYM